MEEARAQLAEFLREASVEGKPRRWMARDMHRHAPPAEHAPLAYAYNPIRGGVCAIVAMAYSPFVITVVVRKYARQEQRLREERARADRRAATGPRPTRFLRRLKDAV
ncbi:MAG: hypothetical protein ACHQ9S_27135 [Candidatus Binatia bacterium]